MVTVSMYLKQKFKDPVKYVSWDQDFNQKGVWVSHGDPLFWFVFSLRIRLYLPLDIRRNFSEWIKLAPTSF